MGVDVDVHVQTPWYIMSTCTDWSIDMTGDVVILCIYTQGWVDRVEATSAPVHVEVITTCRNRGEISKIERWSSSTACTRHQPTLVLSGAYLQGRSLAADLCRLIVVDCVLLWGRPSADISQGYFVGFWNEFVHFPTTLNTIVSWPAER